MDVVRGRTFFYALLVRLCDSFFYGHFYEFDKRDTCGIGEIGKNKNKGGRIGKKSKRITRRVRNIHHSIYLQVPSIETVPNAPNRRLENNYKCK